MDWATCTADHDYTASTKNFASGRGGNSIDRIIIHHNAGNLTFASVLNAFNSNGTSAHYDVRGTEVAQFVYDSNTAYHAGNYSVNQRSIGIEHCNDVNASPWTVSAETLDTGAHLVAALCVLFKLGEPTWGKNVFGHNEVKATACPGALASGGSQHDEYMAKAKSYYAQMTGTASSGSSSSGSSSGSSSSTLDLGPDETVFGKKFARALQSQRGTTVDGVISGQAKSDAAYFWCVDDGVVEYGSTGSDVFRSLQKMLIAAGYSCGSTGADGFYGQNSIKAHQRWLQAKGYSIGTSGVDGYHGHDTNAAMAQALKDGAYK